MGPTRLAQVDWVRVVRIVVVRQNARHAALAEILTCAQIKQLKTLYSQIENLWLPCLKFVKISEFYEIFKIRKIRCIASLVTEVFEFAQQLAVDYTEATVEWEQWAVMTQDCDSDTGEDNEASGDS